MLDHLKELDRQVGELEAQIKAWHRRSALSQKLEKVPGIGPLGASALVASIADARSFDNGRQMSAWMGVPRPRRQPTLLGISKRGDVYLRTLLIHGARSADPLPRSARRRHPGCRSAASAYPNVAAVALANAPPGGVLAHDREFQPDYVSTRAAA